MFFPDVLQFVRRANGHAGPVERVVEFRVLLLHEQTVSRHLRATVQNAAQRDFQVQQYIRDVRVGSADRGRGLDRPKFLTIIAGIIIANHYYYYYYYYHPENRIQPNIRVEQINPIHRRITIV